MKKIDSLQVIRAFAFLGIFTAHSDIAAFSPGGAWGVSVFFILSGFLMFRSYYDTERISDDGIVYSVKFGTNKIKKIYPLHIATLLIAMPIMIIGHKAEPGFGKIAVPAAKTIANVLLVQSWFPSSRIYFSLNSVSWYLSASLFLYIMFPVILSRMKKYRGSRTATAVLVAAFLIQLSLAFVSYLVQTNLVHDDDFIHWFAYIFPLSRLEDFVIGCNLGYIFVKAEENKRPGMALCTLLEFGTIALAAIQLTAYALCVSIPAKTNPAVGAKIWWGLTVMWTPSSCALVYLFALNRGLLSKVLTNRILVFVGNLSASAFLIHQIVYKYLCVLENKMFGGICKSINLFACFIITVICAYAWDKMTCRFNNRQSTPGGRRAARN